MKNKPKKIIYLVTEDWYFCSHRIELARAAQEKGFDVVVCTRVINHKNEIEREGFRLISWEINRSGKNIIQEIKSIFFLLILYLKEKPDIVHHVALKPTIYGSIVARIACVPLVVNALAGLGHVFIEKGWKANLLKKIVQKFFKVALFGKNIFTIFQNPDDLREFVNRKLISPDRVFLIKGSGADTKTFFPKLSPGERLENPLVVLVGRMLWTKGVGEFVEASKILKENGVKARMVLVGSPDPLNPASIPLAEIEEWASSGIIEYFGQRSDMASLFQSSSVAVLPSYREGLPKALIEAAACGLPLVSFDVPGCREIVRHGENGFLVPFKDSRALANAIIQLVEDPEKRRVFGNRSRELVLEEFSLEKVIFSTLEIYSKIM